jgi:hypothetical protein
MTDAQQLLALADAIAAALPAGERAIADVIAQSSFATGHELRTRHDGRIAMVTVVLAPRVTLEEWNRVVVAPAQLPPPPQLMSPSNVPHDAWGTLPVYFTYSRPWGELKCEHAYGDSARRLRKLLIVPR